MFNTKRFYYYDGIRLILEKRKNGQNWQTSKVYTLQDGAIGYIISEYNSSGGTNMWYHYDRLGNVMDLTDENGNLSASYDQDAFGNVLSGSTSAYHLTTKEFSPSIALYYFFQRWYDPQLGRFIQKSKLSPFFEQEYIYLNNNPIEEYDIYGRLGIGKGLKKLWECVKEVLRIGKKAKDAKDTAEDASNAYKECCKFGDQSKEIEGKKKSLEMIKERMKTASGEEYAHYSLLLKEIEKSIADEQAGLCSQIQNCIDSFLKNIGNIVLPF